MHRLLACALVVVAPAVSVAAPQPQWQSCSSRPEGFIDLDDSASVWPAGKVVVLEGFVGSVQQDERSTQFSVKVCARLLDGSRSLPTPRTASHSPPCQCPRSTCAPRAVPLQQLTKHSITLPGSLCAHRPAVHISCTAIAVSRCA